MSILPQRISAGITFDRPIVLTAYPASEWTLSVALRGVGEINITAVAESDTHRLLVDAETTSNWMAGKYWYTARVYDGEANLFEVESGEIIIDPDLSMASAGFDGSTHAQRTLAAIEAVLEKRATRDQEKYSINNRELSRTPISDLLLLRDRYRTQVRQEMKAKRGDLFNTSVRVVFR